MADIRKVSGAGSYREVLRLPAAKPMLFAGSIGQLPIGMVALALVLAIDRLTGSYSVAGLAVGAYMVAIAVVAPLWGRCVDRLGASGVLVGMGLGFVLATVLLTVILSSRMPLWMVIAAVVVVGFSRPVLFGTLQSLWAQLAVDDEVRAKAYSLHAQELGFVWIVGPLIVSGLLGAFGQDTGPLLTLAIAGVLGGVGAVVVARVWRLHGRPHPQPSRTPTASQERAHERREPLYTRSYLVVLASSALFEVAVGSSQVGIIASADLSGHPSMSGILVALLFIGCIIGGLWSGTNSPGLPMMQRYRRSLLVLAVSYGIYTVAPSPWLLAGALLAGGMALAWTFSAQYGVIADLTPPTARAEGFNWLSTMATGGAALGAALAGPLIEYFGNAYVAFIISALFALAAASATTSILVGRR